MTRPFLCFAMDPERTRYVFDAAAIERLADICTVLDPLPIEAFHNEYADQLLKKAEILVTGWGCPVIDKAVLDKAPGLKLIAHSAGTVKYIIAPETYERGIKVTHAAPANAVPVAEFTVASIVFANKRIFELRELYRKDPTRMSSYAVMNQPIGNYRKAVGIVGASRIGRRVVELLRPYDFEILLYDPFVGPSDPVAEVAELVSLDDLMRRSDVVSVHAPSLPTTRHMIAGRELGLMRDGTTLINTARGALIDEGDLLAELQTGRISAVIDVTDPEIPPPNSPFFTLPNVFLTPHAAGAVGTERTRLGRLVVEEIERFVSGQRLRYAVHQDTLERLA